MMSSMVLLTLTASTIVVSSTFFSVPWSRNIGFLSQHPEPKSFFDDEPSEVIPIIGAVGPESFAFDPNEQGPYTGVSDGRILKWLPNERRWQNFSITSPNRAGCELGGSGREEICGRPLGLEFDKRTGDLYIADAYMGLVAVGSNGGLATAVNVVASQQRQDRNAGAFRFTNGLDVHPTTGVVYFTDSSQHYVRRNHVSVITSGDKTGRLLKYDPDSKEITVMLSNLSFPNGVALAQNGQFLLVAETTSCRILRVWLETPKAGSVEVFAELPGFPDNIKRNSKGDFWVAIHSRRGRMLKWILSKYWVGNALADKLPFDLDSVSSYVSKFRGHGLAVKLGEDGEILEMLEDHKGKIWKLASEVKEKDGYLWIGSVVNPFVVKQKIPK